MRVAVVHSFYSSQQPSGENIVVEAQVNALQERGIEVKLIARRTDDLESKPGYAIGSAARVTTGFGVSPAKELAEFRPDLVHVHNLFPNWGSRWLRKWPGPLVCTVHNYRSMCAAGTLFRNGSVCTLCPDTGSLNAVRHACYRHSHLASVPLAIATRKGPSGDPVLSRASRVVALTPRARSLYAKYGVPDRKLVEIPNFVDDSQFHRTAPGDGPWVYVGRLSAQKGVDGLLRHWPQSAELRIYGDGPLRRDVETASNQHITYGGAVPQHQIPGILAFSKGLVFTSESFEGGIPLSYVEALAAGRAVVVKSGSSAGDDAANSATGVVFNAWADLPAALTAAESNLVALSTRARMHFESTFAKNTWLDRMLKLYGSVLT